MSARITAGIDVGTYEVRVVIASTERAGDLPKIIGTGRAESKGLRHGYIVNNPDVSRSVELALSQAEKAAGVNIKKAFVSIGGIGLSGITSQGSTIVAKGDQEITEADLEQAMLSAEESISATLIQNRKIIYSIPTIWKLDSKQVFGRVLGMKGVKLEVKALFVTCLEPHLEDLVSSVEEAGVEVIDVVASPIAGSFVTLTKSQKIAGCVLVNIGAETVSLVVFENNIPISIEVFSIGGADITHDIALGLKISLEEAESIKLGGVTPTSYSKKKLEEIVSARLSDIFELVNSHLHKISKNGQLPAGIILSGGSSSIGPIAELARDYLHLPSRIATLTIGDNKVQIKDSTWSVAYGLCVIGSIPEEEERLGLKKKGNELFGKITKVLKQFLP